MRVIPGGVPPGLPAPIVWNRLPSASPRALVIRDAEAGALDLAYDDGRPFLVGIRSVRLPQDQGAFDAWLAQAKAEGLELRDERRPRVLEAAQEPGTHMRHAVADLERQRRLRRHREPAGDTPLFDFTRRDQRDLF